MTEQKPVAWRYEWFQEIDIWEHAITEVPPSMWAGREDVRNVEPLYKHPPAPAAPVTTPEVEAARRKALKVILARVAFEKDTSDLYSVRLALAVLRDLVGQPRRYPDTRIGSYDETPVGQVPEKGPEQPVPMLWDFTPYDMADANMAVDMLAEALETKAAGKAGSAWFVMTEEGRGPWRIKARALLRHATRIG